MKKKLILIVLAAITVLFTACDAYYEKWTGTYECENNLSIWTMSFDSSGPGGHTNNYIYQTTVNVISKGGSTLAFLDNRSEECYEAEVNKDGSFCEYVSSSGVRVVEGRLYKNSLYMTIRSGGLGSSSTSTYKGKKIKK